ncbi:hypothetical protein HDU91_006522 [Kappamyces sp. JEL0680]|nr:hypothetical protein HDU91_006522 [Kappamyces sp. JEL0680]
MQSFLFVLAAAFVAASPQFQTNNNQENNFANFCSKQNAKLATGGQATGPGQVMCSQTIQGLIPDVSNMVSALITTPADGSTQNAAKGFTVAFTTTGMATGFAGNPATDFMQFPQTLDPASGRIQGASSLSIQKLTGNQAPAGSSVSFFQLLNQKDDGNGVTQYTVNVPAGAVKTKGLHRICTGNMMAGLTPVVMPVAQRGAQDDCIRVNIV